MAISFACPHCQAKYQVDDDLGGKSAPCLKCGKGIKVPRAKVAASSRRSRAGAPPGTGDIDDGPLALDDSPSPAKKKKKTTTAPPPPAAPLDEPLHLGGSGNVTPAELADEDDNVRAARNMETIIASDPNGAELIEEAEEAVKDSDDDNWDAIFPGDSLVGAAALPSIAVTDVGSGLEDGYAPKHKNQGSMFDMMPPNDRPDLPPGTGLAQVPESARGDSASGLEKDLELIEQRQKSGIYSGDLTGVSSPGDSGLPFHSGLSSIGKAQSDTQIIRGVTVPGADITSAPPPAAPPPTVAGLPQWAWIAGGAAVLMIVGLLVVVLVIVLTADPVADAPTTPPGTQASGSQQNTGSDDTTDPSRQPYMPPEQAVEPTPTGSENINVAAMNPTPNNGTTTLPTTPTPTPPSDEPHPAVAEALKPISANTPRWPIPATFADNLAKPVAIAGFSIQPPQGWQLIDEGSDFRKNQFTWDNPDASENNPARLTITVTERADNLQKRPVVLTAPDEKIPAAAQGMLTYQLPDGEVKYGWISGLPATHSQPSLVQVVAAKRWMTYYDIFTKTHHINITGIAGTGDANGKEMAQASALSLAQITGNGSNLPLATDMLLRSTRTPEQLAAMLSSNRREVPRVIRQIGPSMEEHLIPLLTSKSNAARQEAAALLGDVGSPERSYEPLLVAAGSDDRDTAIAAKQSLRKLAPERFDTIAEALLDLGSSDAGRQRVALRELSRTEVKPEVHEAVAEAITPFLDSKDETTNRYAHEAAGHWLTEGFYRRFAEVLRDRKAAEKPRRMAMTALSKSTLPYAAEPITWWILSDSSHAQAALREMGPVAEVEVAKLMSNRQRDVQLAAIRLLEHIGTKRSLNRLLNMSRMRNDSGLAAAAERSMNAIREREGMPPN